MQRRSTYLEDVIPSAAMLELEIRRCIYDVISNIELNLEKETDLSEEECEIDMVLDEITDTSRGDDFFTSGLPLAFGSSHNRNSNRKKYRRMRAAKVDEETPIREQNTLLGLYKDGLCYPCRVLGVGPSGLDFCIARFLIQDEAIELHRETELFPIPLGEWKSYTELLLTCEDQGGLWAGSAVDKLPHMKYWDQRYRFFSLYDHGVQIPDKDSWFSVTPEAVARHVAKQCQHFSGLAFLSPTGEEGLYSPIRTVLDCFRDLSSQYFGSDCESDQRADLTTLVLALGCGGDSVQLATVFDHVLALDLDESRLQALSVNAAIYGVRHRIDLVCANCYDILRSLPIIDRRRQLSNELFSEASVDVAVLAPPWGGPEYVQSQEFDLRTMVTSGDGIELVVLAARHCMNVVYLLPKNVADHQLEELQSLLGLDSFVENVYLWGKLKMTIAYFGPMFRSARQRKKLFLSHSVG